MDPQILHRGKQILHQKTLEQIKLAVTWHENINTISSIFIFSNKLAAKKKNKSRKQSHSNLAIKYSNQERI